MSHPPFLDAGGLSWTAEVTPVPVLGDQFHLCIRSRYAHAREPEAANVAFRLTLGRAELEHLIADLQRGLSSHPVQESH